MKKIGLMGGLGPASTVDYYMENVKDADMIKQQYLVPLIYPNLENGIVIPEEAEETNENHKIFIERVEDEYYVRIEHDKKSLHFLYCCNLIGQDTDD